MNWPAAIHAILASLIPFYPLISETAQAYDLDPILVSSQIRAESSFNPRAVSPVGAIGLMQIMPSTAKWLGFPHKPAQLMNPALNVRIGCHYDAFLRAYWSRKGYKGGMLEALVLSSYNAGPGRTKRALMHGLLDESKLPRETRSYIRRIAQFRLHYMMIIVTRMGRR